MKVLVSVYETNSNVAEPILVDPNREMKLVTSFCYESDSFLEPLVFEAMTRAIEEGSTADRFLIITEGVNQLNAFFYQRNRDD